MIPFTPYYDQDGITIYNADCRQVLPFLQFDVVVTDPPYGIDYSTGTTGKYNGTAIEGDSATTVRDAVLSMTRGKPALVFGSWKASIPTEAKALLVWEKGSHVGMGNLSIPWKPNFEFIFVLGGGFHGKRTSGVVRFNALSPNFVQQRHPTEKPVGLMRELLCKCPDGLVLDPFMGSGTTLVAAKMEGRAAVGIEINEAYCESAVKRLQQGVLF